MPTKKGRKKRLDFLLNETRTMIFYESPLRLLKTIEEFKNIFGDERKVSVSREISKIYEETINGSLSKVYEILLNKKITIFLLVESSTFFLFINFCCQKFLRMSWKNICETFIFYFLINSCLRQILRYYHKLVHVYKNVINYILVSFISTSLAFFLLQQQNGLSSANSG